MRIIALDVGTGTQDLLLYDENILIENSTKMVMPSQTAIVAKRIKAATAQGQSLFLCGETMGGGPSSAAVWAHLQSGYRVFATPRAAKTLNDNLDKVSSSGIKITDSCPYEDCLKIEMRDVDVNAIRSAFERFDISLPTTCAVACQDHGETYGSNRVFRFQHFESLIKKGGELSHFVYSDGNIPSYLTRLQAVYRTLNDGGLKTVFLMDTGPAAIFGALCDDVVATRAFDPHIVVNVGNGHTLAAILHQKRVVGMFEHHTSAVSTAKLEYLLSKFMDGSLTQKQVFEDGGHGCYIDQTGFEEIDRAYKERGFRITVIGPNRGILRGSRLDPYFAVPGGDMMLAGCFGLVMGSQAVASI